MRMPRTAAAAAAALALLLCASGAAAQPAADCHSNFTAGTWWENMEPHVLRDVENITHAIAHHYDKLVRGGGTRGGGGGGCARRERCTAAGPLILPVGGSLGRCALGGAAAPAPC